MERILVDILREKVEESKAKVKAKTSKKNQKKKKNKRKILTINESKPSSLIEVKESSKNLIATDNEKVLED